MSSSAIAAISANRFFEIGTCIGREDTLGAGVGGHVCSSSRQRTSSWQAGPGELEGFADDVQVGSVGVEVAVGHADLAAGVGQFSARSAVGGGQGCR